VKILIAEDDPFFRRLLQQLLASECEVAMVEDGAEAWNLLQGTEAPVMAILDWVMPGMAGPEICRAVRANLQTAGTYLILLTSRHSSADILAGLRSGADDYVTKPFKFEELRARVRLGQRIIRLEQSLMAQNAELETTRGREVQLQNRAAALESSGQEAIARAAAAGVGYSGSLDTLTVKAEFTAGNTPTAMFPVNNSKVS
jgi:phosphoserine phosphatase RsbU/P